LDVDDTVRSRAVEKAVQILGGAEQLADRLGLAPGTVRLLMDGKLPVPQHVFLKVVDIISADDDRSPNGKSKKKRN
jgi:DNA-binding transcriptional regulator YdaS (Cro superfamily)